MLDKFRRREKGFGGIEHHADLVRYLDNEAAQLFKDVKSEIEMAAELARAEENPYTPNRVSGATVSEDNEAALFGAGAVAV